MVNAVTLPPRPGTPLYDLNGGGALVYASGTPGAGEGILPSTLVGAPPRLLPVACVVPPPAGAVEVPPAPHAARTVAPATPSVARRNARRLSPCSPFALPCPSRRGGSAGK